MKPKKIIILGDSVALRIRPPRKTPDENTYTEHLQMMFSGTIVKNMAMGAKPLFAQIKERDIFLRELPDLYILNFGIVDCSNRPIPYWLFKYINNFSENEGIIHKSIRKTLSFFENKYRKRLVQLRNYKPWTSPKTFALLYSGFINQLKKETSSHIICIGINQTNSRVEDQLPGTQNRIKEYNRIILRNCHENDCIYVNPEDIINSEENPDGIHFNALGHRKMAEILRNIIYNLS